MHQLQLQLSDQLYNQAKRRAAEAGFGSVEEFAADLLEGNLAAEGENFDHVFTAERLALIDKAEAQIEAGHCMTAKDADIELARRRAEWLQDNHV